MHSCAENNFLHLGFRYFAALAHCNKKPGCIKLKSPFRRKTLPATPACHTSPRHTTHPHPSNTRWRTEISRMGVNAAMKDFWLKYGDWESLLCFFFWMKHTSAADVGAYMPCGDCSEAVCRQSVACVRQYLNHVVQEIQWQVESLHPLSPFLFLHDPFHRLHAHQFHWGNFGVRTCGTSDINLERRLSSTLDDPSRRGTER